MNRADLVRRSGELAANLHELAHRFELIKKAAEDDRDPLGASTLTTLQRVILDASVRIDYVGSLTERASRLLDIDVRSSSIPAAPRK